MGRRKLLMTGLIGTAIAALCCFTPALVVLMGVLGLSAFTGYIDFVAIPALVLFCSIAVFALIGSLRADG